MRRNLWQTPPVHKELTLLSFLLTWEVFLFLFLIICIEGNELYFSRGGAETAFLLRATDSWRNWGKRKWIQKSQMQVSETQPEQAYTAIRYPSECTLAMTHRSERTSDHVSLGLASGDLSSWKQLSSYSKLFWLHVTDTWLKLASAEEGRGELQMVAVETPFLKALLSPSPLWDVGSILYSRELVFSGGRESKLLAVLCWHLFSFACVA